MGKLDNHLVGRGFRRLSTEWGLYVLERNGQKVYLLVYVDDILLLSSKSTEGTNLRNWAKAELSRTFKMTQSEKVDWILGLKLTRNEATKTIGLSQPGYIDQILERFDMSKCHPLSTPNRTKHLL